MDGKRVPASAWRSTETLTRNLGHGGYLDDQIRMVQAHNLAGSGDRKRRREELLSYVTRGHEVLDVGRIVNKRGDIRQSSVHGINVVRMFSRTFRTWSRMLPGPTTRPSRSRET